MRVRAMMLTCRLLGRGITGGSGWFFRPFGKRDKQGDALVQKWADKKVEEMLWDASEKMVREKGFDV